MILLAFATPSSKPEPELVGQSKLYTGREIELKVETRIENENETKVNIKCGIKIRNKSVTGTGMRSSSSFREENRGYLADYKPVQTK
ncbi:hypothetical protein EVAR_19134_1 [Eumeta japonica]|uniref:Uncharacterized protein n=1 Tax=Eumeta variegata TaxID=151549 RepID=A0A4C1VNR7_EUMVA|nr:hypothetical protein EVAR_19134_1 [Eumeta japonica]